MSFYHYAIILKKSIVVRKINIEKTTIPKSVQEYSVFYMGCGDNDADETFVELIRLAVEGNFHRAVTENFRKRLNINSERNAFCRKHMTERVKIHLW